MSENEPSKKSRGSATRSRQNTATATVKGDNKPKPDTKRASFDLYKQGKTINEIATERNLKPQTIFSHLAFYALRGEIPMETLLPTAHRTMIEKVIAKTGTDDGTKAIKSLCPPEISYEEIRLVITLMKGSKSQA